jgi:hypothetical protein
MFNNVAFLFTISWKINLNEGGKEEQADCQKLLEQYDNNEGGKEERANCQKLIEQYDITNMD